MMPWLIDTLTDVREGKLRVGPLVIASQRRILFEQRSAFELGQMAGPRDRVPAPQKRHLRSI